MPRPRRLMLSMLAAGLLAAGCGGGDDEATTTPAADETPAATGGGGAAASAGRDTFASTCGGCHTLSDAGTDGQVGPNLDEVAPDEQEVLTAIQTGPGQMPENLVEGEQAQQVAEYVAGAAAP